MGGTLASEYAAAGVALSAATNNRLVGLNRVHTALAWDEGHPPELQIFATCVNLLRTLPNLPHDERRVEDVDSRAEDHAYDALRYGLLGAGAARGLPKSETYTFGKGVESRHD